MGPKKDGVVEEEVGDYEPYDHRDVDKPLTNLETAFHLVKITFGTGILALPKAVQKTGWVLGILLTAIAGAINTLAMLILTNAAYLLCKKFKKPSCTLGEVFAFAIENVSPNNGKHGRRLINSFVFLHLVTVTCAYVMFIADSLVTVINAHTEKQYQSKEFILMSIVFLMLINTMPTLKLLVHVSVIGHVLTLFVFLALFYYIFRDEIKISDRTTFDFSGLAFYYGHVIFAIMPIIMVMSLENKMKDPGSFRTPCGVLSVTMTVNTIITCALGIIGYLKYGDELEDVITNNLPHMDILSQMAKVGYSVAIAVDFALNAFLLYELIFEIIYADKPCSKKWYYRYTFRFVNVLVVCLVCYLLPDFNVFINLAGSIAFTTLGFLVPPISDLCIRWSKDLTRKQKICLICKDGLVIVVGIGGMLYGTYGAVKDIIDFYKN